MMEISKEKRCSKCSKVYPATLEYFNKDKKGRNGLRSRCKICTRLLAKQRVKNGYKTPGREKTLHEYNNSAKGKAAQQRYRQTKKGKALSRRAKLKYCYGMINEDYNKLFQQQRGYCAMCGKHQLELKRRLDIDHDHKTGGIRGLLCGGCNMRLGRFERGRKYNKYFTQKCMEYLHDSKENYR